MCFSSLISNACAKQLSCWNDLIFRWFLNLAEKGYNRNKHQNFSSPLANGWQFFSHFRFWVLFPPFVDIHANRFIFNQTIACIQPAFLFYSPKAKHNWFQTLNTQQTDTSNINAITNHHTSPSKPIPLYLSKEAFGQPYHLVSLLQICSNAQLWQVHLTFIKSVDRGVFVFITSSLLTGVWHLSRRLLKCRLSHGSLHGTYYFYKLLLLQ